MQNIRNIVSEILDSQFRGQPITVTHLIKLHGKSSKSQLSEGAIYNALRTLRKAGILMSSPLTGRKNTLSIDYMKARDNTALLEVGERAAEIEHLPEAPRKDLLSHIRWEIDTLAKSDEELIYQMHAKYGNQSLEIYEPVIVWIRVKALSFVMKYMKEGHFDAPEKLNGNHKLHFKTLVKHTLQSETLSASLWERMKAGEEET